ncbi:hypothetical protein CDO44_02290 [Pigmentiphaga sp. NML080357]|uniref:hypothetical protein n=1 Tax=Pigmentiphaga sp. NML080357 TaxID=2008675 RepID=UPI000B41FD9D|nr:hypothetical protein [Pigmentiphaga sp. NML080357]OVZ64220.1 hypothetical protein CDO44_02290 [Pigmentiphaga sp. NML080357]
MIAVPPRLVRLVCRLGLAAGLACPALPATAATNPESPYAARQGFAFALLGNVPFNNADETIVAQMLGQFGTETDLAIHTGNVKGRDERCDDETYIRRHTLLNASPVPLVLAPGENDWADCDRAAAGQYGPVERLNRLRELFFEPDNSLGTLTLDLQRQSETVRFRGYPENARWEYGDILFVTMNVPGNHNNYRTGAGRNGEYEERVQADSSWLRQAFSAAAKLKTRGLVVAFAADPRFEGRHEYAGGTDPYASLKADLARLASKYTGQVLVVHGGNGPPEPHLPDHPVKLNGKTLQNVTRIRTYGHSRPAYWIKVSVEPGDKQVFRMETVNTVLRPPQPR